MIVNNPVILPNDADLMREKKKEEGRRRGKKSTLLHAVRMRTMKSPARRATAEKEKKERAKGKRGGKERKGRMTGALVCIPGYHLYLTAIRFRLGGERGRKGGGRHLEKRREDHPFLQSLRRTFGRRHKEGEEGLEKDKKGKDQGLAARLEHLNDSPSGILRPETSQGGGGGGKGDYRGKKKKGNEGSSLTSIIDLCAVTDALFAGYDVTPSCYDLG